MMKIRKASLFLKHITSLLSSIARAKSMSIKSKTSELRARLVMLSLVKGKKALLSPISNKIHSILGQREKDSDEEVDDYDNDKAIVLYGQDSSCPRWEDTYVYGYGYGYDDGEEDDKYPDLRHSLFDEDFDDPGGSIIDIVKNSKEEGEDFKLEDEIDHVADLFIMRFHKQMRLQKLESFKRYQEMLARGL
ncbi:hypothetical protein K2173_006934 [Erythroxylum novogranatense]|uniref:Uncharacterized protein n=1 Tax=Erythroxylum novogranatense TaxID=1862640 RepID=A0AAV8SZD9_9ROSI|nr:hypothetical protein K2173_006934 [Erythroxylum novogranatense]